MNRAINKIRKANIATPGGLAFAIGFMIGVGGMCPKCGHGTRATSKNWARCKKCNARVARNPNVFKTSP